MFRQPILLLIAMKFLWQAAGDPFVVVAAFRSTGSFVRRQGRQPQSLRILTRSEASTASTESGISTRRNGVDWKSFDYLQHWYPVSWVCDVRPNQPVKVSLFDVDYVIAIHEPIPLVSLLRKNNKRTLKTSSNAGRKVLALLDVCPHKAAALSEGRIVPSTGAIQCAYHGWSFDGSTGICQEIPQSAASSKTAFSDRTCAKAVPAVIHQGMIWLWPGPKRLTTPYPTPPMVPEMDDDQFTVTRVVRDFPTIDWTLLVSNILDPDHGLFAHQMPPFDFYSASTEYPLTIVESTTRGSFNSSIAYPSDGDEIAAHNSAAASSVLAGGWYVQSTVPAVEKLLRRDKVSRGRPVSDRNQTQPLLLATSTFEAPTTITLSRRRCQTETTDASTTNTNFVTAFWVCPTGTGKSRFFSAAIAKSPRWLKIPRWVFHVNLNNFLDQDTVLVSSQQPHVLTAEALGMGRSSSLSPSTISPSKAQKSHDSISLDKKSDPGRGLFIYSSPTDRMVRLLDQFWDATVRRVPNRAVALQELYMSGALRHTPSRQVALDRNVQHLQICPDSQDTVRRCRFLRNVSLLVAVATILAPTLLAHSAPMLPSKYQQRWAIAFVAATVSYMSEKLRQSFYFCYPETKRNSDLKKIPAKTWMDPSISKSSP